MPIIRNAPFNLDVAEAIEANRHGWNLRARQHFDTEYYGVDKFLAGQSVLNSLELDTVGDVSGLSLLHLQCHFGLETLSFARLGAQVTGADLSDDAIAKARELAAHVAPDARFIRANLYDLPDLLDEEFDVVFTSYGALACLPDLPGWARSVAHLLKPDGRACIVEIHPFLPLFTESDGELRLTYSLFDEGAFGREVVRTYADLRPVEPHMEYSWRWTVSGLVTALAEAGLRVEVLRELPIDNRQRFPSMMADEQGYWHVPGDPFPLSVTCVAQKPS
jgi:2-polyprenyl-3-methyl-5-hydroxy-6-metoxy-1,4-benzoquinol methylase